MHVTSYLNLNFDEIPFRERIDRAADAGVDGIEFYGWGDLGVDQVETVGDAFYEVDFDVEEVAEHVHDRGLELVYLSGDRPALTNPSLEEQAVTSIRRSLELADRIDCHLVNVKAGPVQSGYTRETQRQQVVRVLRRVAPDVEDADTGLALEPINAIDAPTEFLNTAAEGYAILDAVDSPDIELLLDLYHEQLTRGNIINNIRENAGEYVAHIHAADPPARAQPGTGELNWSNVLAALAETEYDGYLGGEFIPQGTPTDALASFAELGHGV